MRRVPRLSMPEDMPEGVRVAIDVIGNNVRTEILRVLARQPLTTLELAERIRVHHASVHRHLVLLEKHGLVIADVGRGRRRGQTVTWRTDKKKVAEVGKLWIDYTSGDD
jgi:DNA-binding transcriptional ArsR family regulator